MSSLHPTGGGPGNPTAAQLSPIEIGTDLALDSNGIVVRVCQEHAAEYRIDDHEAGKATEVRGSIRFATRAGGAGALTQGCDAVRRVGPRVAS